MNLGPKPVNTGHPGSERKRKKTKKKQRGMPKSRGNSKKETSKLERQEGNRCSRSTELPPHL
jgi:hypothetical protein